MLKLSEIFFNNRKLLCSRYLADTNHMLFNTMIYGIPLHLLLYEQIKDWRKAKILCGENITNEAKYREYNLY